MRYHWPSIVGHRAAADAAAAAAKEVALIVYHLFDNPMWFEGEGDGQGTIVLGKAGVPGLG